MKRMNTNYAQEVKDALTDIVHEEFGNIASMEWTNSANGGSQPIYDLSSPLDEDEALAMENETFDIEEILEGKIAKTYSILPSWSE